MGVNTGCSEFNRQNSGVQHLNSGVENNDSFSYSITPRNAPFPKYSVLKF